MESKIPVRVGDSKVSAIKKLLRKHLYGRINYKIEGNSKFTDYGLGMQTV